MRPPAPSLRALPRLSTADFTRIQRFMHDVSGVDLSTNKQAMVESRLAKRVAELGLPGFAEYWSLVSAPQSEAERQYVINALSTNETFFFREPEHFHWLAEFARQRQRPTAPFRVWSAAASTGEEAYSIAITLQEALGEQGHFEVLASDINTQVLEDARRAIYSRHRTQKVPPHLIQRYFIWGRDEYRGMLKVVPELCRHVSFRQLNLTDCASSPIGEFDVIFLRNVLIYFNPDTKLRVLDQLSKKLRSDGVLAISHSESLNNLQTGLCPFRPSLYRKRDQHG